MSNENVRSWHDCETGQICLFESSLSLSRVFIENRHFFSVYWPNCRSTGHVGLPSKVHCAGTFPIISFFENSNLQCRMRPKMC